MPSLFTLVDEPKDILALFAGIFLTVAFIAMIFLIPELREIFAGALIAVYTLIFNHFFTKAPTS